MKRGKVKFTKEQYEKLKRFEEWLYSVLGATRRTKLTLCEIEVAIDCYNEIVETGKAETYLSNVIDVFRRKGFSVEPDENGVNYSISI